MTSVMLVVVGAVLVLTGTFLIYWPAGLIVLGGFAIAAGLLLPLGDEE